jgi:hypothetical protein
LVQCINGPDTLCDAGGRTFVGILPKRNNNFCMLNDFANCERKKRENEHEGEKIKENKVFYIVSEGNGFIRWHQMLMGNLWEN